MIVEVAADELIVSPDVLTSIEREAAEIMRRAAEFLPPEVRNPPRVTYVSDTGLASRAVVFEALAAAAWALTVVTVTYAAIQAVQAVIARRTDKEMRKVRTTICVQRCLDIIANARGNAENFEQLARKRALQTVDSQKRNRRKFESRK